MQHSETNPYRSSQGAQSNSPANLSRLNWAGRLVVGMVCAAGIAFFAYWGVQLGAIIGIQRSMPHLSGPPTKGIGLAPDLSGLADAALAYSVTMILSLLISIALGTFISATGGYFVLAPLLRKVRALTVN